MMGGGQKMVSTGQGAQVRGGEFAFRVAGMDCAEEVGALRRELEPIPGVERLDFDLLRERLVVVADPGLVAVEELQRAVRRTGMRAEPWRQEPAAEPVRRLDGRTLRTLAAGLLLIAAFLLHALLAGSLARALGAEAMPLAVKGLYLASVLLGILGILPKAWGSLRRLRPDMNLLMTIAVAGAVGIGQWFEAATVTVLFSVSLLLESWSVGRARRAVSALLELSPQEATVLHGPGERMPDCRGDPCDEHEHPDAHHEHRLPAAEVSVGSVVLVRPGEKVPLDGVVLRGRGSIDQSPITGESVPVEKEPGDEVFAGTLNGEGALEVRATKPAGDSTLARIIRLVGEAGRRRSPSERFVERFAAIYTPAVLGLALLTAVVPPLFLGGAWGAWLYNALVLLVIGCPCALVLSTPVSVVCALASAARRGILLKGGPFVEEPARLRCIALDKTGTLTRGKPILGKVLAFAPHTEEEVLEASAAIEARSEHPLARAIVARAREGGLRPVPAESYRALPGRGAEAIVAGKPYWLGSHRLLEERGQESPGLHGTLEKLAAEGATVVVLGTDHHVCGVLALADEPREEARGAIENLHRAGIRKIVMLTGDNPETGSAIGARLGVDDVRAGLLPEDKVAQMQALVCEWGHVAMIGDGVNDAPAMMEATLGVAMGAAGTDAAIETADAVIMADDLLQLPWLIRHSRRALAIIRGNIAAALLVKALFFVLAFLGLANLWSAVAADMGVSLAVVANALRLLGPGQGPAPPSGQ